LGTDHDMSLKYMDETLKDLLQHWFGIGTLNLQRITWESSALVLEKVNACLRLME
jgi:hypothetical protein